MTGRDLKNDGWIPQQCKVGTLYFKDRLFCHIKGNKAIVFDASDDMNPIGEASSVGDLEKIRMKRDAGIIRETEDSLIRDRMRFKEKYGVNPDEHLSEGIVLGTMKLKVVDIINEGADDTVFAWSPPKDLLGKLTKGGTITVKIIKDGNQREKQGTV